jgi:hypothetical protein
LIVRVDRIPKATLLAIGLLIGVELFLRTIPIERLLPRAAGGPGVHTDSGPFSVLAMVDARGSADIALVGSSMMREAVNVPQMRETLQTRFHRRLTVGDYSVRGAKIEELAATTDQLLASKRPPKLLFIGLSLRDLQIDPEERRAQNLAPYAQLSDWYEARFAPPAPPSPSEIRNPKLETSTKPEVEISTPRYPLSSILYPLPPSPPPPALLPALKNTLTRHCRLLRHREQLRELVLHPTRRLPPAEVNPITGKAGENFRSLVAEGLVTVKEIRKQHNRQSRTNSLGAPPTPPALAILDETIARARAGAQQRNVKIILIEMPIPKVMRKALPQADYADFLTKTSAIAQRHNIPFLQRQDFERLNFPPNNGYFLDSQHMNSHGNTRFATILATVAARHLKEQP